MTLRLTRRQYADLYGPTTGDRVRLADTELFIRVERDLTVAGEEAKFGGGKVIRDGMGQSARATRADGVLDLLRTNEMDMRVDTAGGDDATFARNHLGCRADGHGVFLF